MKIKMIDLLIKIANGDIPKRIKYENHYFDYSKLEKDYYEGMGYDYEYFFKNISLIECLNDEVEILEEEKKIPEKIENEKEFYAYTRYEKNKDEIDKVLYILKAINLAEEKIDNLNNSINSIIDYLKSKGE